jgi:ribose-phosphate pyrophosphokinase
VDDVDFASPGFSPISGSVHGTPRVRGLNTMTDEDDSRYDPMAASFLSTVSSIRQDGFNDDALGGSADAAASDEEEEEDLHNPDFDITVTLIGNVRDRPVFIVDDMIDKAGTWIAAAETVVKRGLASRVYCMATHGLFGEDSLREMQDCEFIDGIIVTNSFPIPAAKKVGVTKLTELDVAPLLSEAIRRNHYGENLSQLYMQFAE